MVPRIDEETRITTNLGTIITAGGSIIGFVIFISIFSQKIWFKTDQAAYALEIEARVERNEEKIITQKMEIKDVNYKIDLLLERLNVYYDKRRLPSLNEKPEPEDQQ